MDGANFYSPYGYSSHHQRLPRQQVTVSDHAGYEPLGSSVSNVALNQKLDRVLELVEVQRQDSIDIKKELATLRSDVDKYRGESASLSSSTPSSPATPVGKLPLELSVSIHSVMWAGLILVLF